MFDIREPSIAALRSAPVKFRYGSNKRTMLVDALTASAVLAVYDAVNDENKAKFERMTAASQGQFIKIVNFCWSKVKV